MLRSPTANLGVTREFAVVDQLLPVPYINPNALLRFENANWENWIPLLETSGGFLGEIRRFADFRAYHDAGFTQSEMTYDSRLVGRSVWNTRWILIIPAGYLLADRNEGLQRFINGTLVGGQRTGNGVSDIKIFFQTYSY